MTDRPSPRGVTGLTKAPGAEVHPAALTAVPSPASPRKAAVRRQAASPAPAAPPAQPRATPRPVEPPREPFSTRLLAGTTARLDRVCYEQRLRKQDIVDDALAAWLAAHDPAGG